MRRRLDKGGIIMAKSPSENRVGAFFLIPPCKKYKSYRIGCYNAATGQTDKFSIRTTDKEQAEARLSEHHLKAPKRKNGKAPKPHDEPLLQCLNRYYLNYLIDRPSADKFKDYALPLAIEFFGKDGMVSDLTDDNQLRFITAMRRRPTKLNGVMFADSTIKRILGMWIAAVGHAVLFGHLDPAHAPKRIKAKKWKPRLRKGKKLLKVEQLAKLFEAASRHEHWWRYMICAVATIGRPGAVRDLTGAQCDLEYRIINLLPEGDEQHDNKVRPLVPMCPTMERWVRQWNTQGHFVTWRGKPLGDGTFWALLSKAAGVRSTPKYMRSTMISWLAAKGVPRWERSAAAGHSSPDGNTQDDYAVYDPEYLRNVSDAVEALFEALQPLVKKNLLLRPVGEDQPLPEEVWQDGCVPLSMAWGVQRLGGEPSSSPPLRHHASDGQFAERGTNVAAPPEGSFRFSELAPKTRLPNVPAKEQVDVENQ